MLERIALHQTRLRTPGLGLESKGVALGAKGVILLPSIDRLVALLSVYTREHSLEDLMPSLEIHVVRSKLGTRELVLSFAAESSDRMDRMAETARLVGGFTFTGTSRHFVQYRDAGAPFGYDASQLLSTDAAYALYHDKFTQTYEADRSIELKSLLLKLMPRVDPSTHGESGLRLLVAEPGLGPALIHYLVRSRVEGEVTVAEWPPASAFDDGPVRRTIVRIPDLPKRMHALMGSTPGITTFLPVGPGVAVEIGYRHPVSLRACPVFDPNGLVLLRGKGAEPWSLDRMPALGDLRAFARVELRPDASKDTAVATSVSQPERVRVPLRVLPSPSPWRNVTATWIKPEEVALLRRLAYALPHDTIARTTIAVTAKGAFLRSSMGIESIPLGTFFVEIHPGLYIPAGYEVTPAIAPDVLHQALGAPAGQILFISAAATALSVDASAFVPLETSLLEAKTFEPVIAEAIERALDESPIELHLEPLGVFALGEIAPPEEPAERGAHKALPGPASQGAAGPNAEVGMAIDYAARAAELFQGFMRPLVVGGEMQPARPLGGKTALRLHQYKSAVDLEAFSLAQLGRLRRVRALAPMDFVPDPTPAEWTMAAVLHDVVQATHPGFESLFRKNAPARLLAIARLTLAQVPLAATPKEALFRHSLFARALDITRVDVKVSWWTGSATFLGTKPPPRLLAWPEARRVSVERTPHALFPLASRSSAVPAEGFEEVTRAFLERTPLTDLATVDRSDVAFTWTQGTLLLVGTRAGRTLATRVLAPMGQRAYAPLGAATEALVAAKKWRAGEVALRVLGEMVLLDAVRSVAQHHAKPPFEEEAPRALSGGPLGGRAFALGAGAVLAKRALEGEVFAYPPAQREALLRVVGPLASSAAARRFEELLSAGGSVEDPAKGRAERIQPSR